MKVLMFGWEFPPFKSGGLGTACRDLTKGLAKRGTEITFVLPVNPDSSPDFVKLIGPTRFRKIKTSQDKRIGKKNIRNRVKDTTKA